MNFDLTDDQEMMRDMFVRFLDEHSSIARVRAAAPWGFDPALWAGLAELGALSIRVPEESGGLGLGLFDAVILMEEAGRTLVSGPLAETLVAARMLALLGGDAATDLLGRVMAGEAVASIAFHDIATQPVQWIGGGQVAQAVVARRSEDIVLIDVPDGARVAEENLADTPMAQIDLGALPQVVLASGADAVATFASGVEEWKLLIAAGLAGIGREALKLAAAYACERKQFDQFIGQFQGISHPLADLLCDVDGGKFLVWKAIRDIADGAPEAGAAISIAAWWNSDAAGRAVAQALHTFGGYGLTTEYDIFLFNLRAKAWPLLLGDPQRLIGEAGRRLYAGEQAALPDAGDMPVDFDLGEDARAITQEIEDFFAVHVTPEMREAFHYSWEGYNPELNRKLAAQNLLYVGLPQDVGGRGLSAYEKTAAMDAFEAEGYNNPAANVTQMVALIVHRFGSEELKAAILPEIMRGEVICSLGYSEPGAGSDVFAAQCRATQEADGSWRIDGTKMFTSGANLSTYVLMLCRTNPDVAKHKGLTMFIVPLKAEGVTIQPVHTFQDERTNITFYDGVKIPDSWRLGAVDGGVRTMSASLELEHGGGFAKYQRAMLHAAETLCREIQCDGQPLIADAGAQARLARTAANLWASELIAFRANWASMEKKPNLAYGPMAKMFSSEKFQSDARDLLDLTAPLSLSKRKGAAAEINMFYRHAQGATIYGGTSEVHRSMIAERALGLPRTRA
ncbi:alkylation response protein AidB-like acyl-CoA dehydrogenase [Sphingobium xenophagum]|uniref:Alkylation response protein AidB-like acyl-CoA dehydrogenase n=1 Tax=Sphingobium xenophagum TaxID=121428 RepID=A0ABU1WZF4_SPHXE|nr:acyl-CoA dehydrogenase [Sphingobium xenophagum]MDR7154202.1 alkylation response protein AidB-like acyl-CoA dehydrogenase [Sphingobium xenophagum]